MKILIVNLIIIIVAFIFFNSNCFAEINSKQINHLFDQNKLIEIEKTLNYIEKTNLSKEEQAEILYFYAKLSLEKNQFTEAINYADDARKILPKDDNQLIIQLNLIKLFSYLIKKDVEKMIKLLDSSEKKAIKFSLNEELADIYQFKGFILQLAGKDKEALSLLNEALPIYLKLNNLKKTIDVELLMIASLNNLAEYEKAFILVKKVQEENSILKNEKIRAKIDVYLAMKFYSKGDYDKSLEYVNEAIKISKKINDELLLVNANTWKGLILLSKEKFDLAEELYLQSLAINRKYFGENSPATASTYGSLSMVNNKKANYLKSLDMSLKSNAIYKNTYGDNHPETAYSYNQLAECYKKLGEDEKALKLYYKSMNICQSIYGKDHINNVTIYKNIADIFFKQHKYYEALDWYNKAFILAKKSYKEDNLFISKLYNDISLCFNNLEDYNKASEYLNKSLNIIINQNNKNNIMTAIGYSNLGTIYEKQYKYDKALEAYLQSKNIIETNNLSNHSAAGILYSQLGWIYKMMNKYDKALYYYQKALNINEKIYDQNNISIALGYFHIAGIFSDIQNDKDALNNYNIALKLMKQTGNYYYLSFIYTDLAYLKQKQKNYKQAIIYYKKALEHLNSIINYTTVKNDKYNFADTNLLISENIIKCLIALNKPKEALFYSDKSRYQDLVSSLTYKRTLLLSIIDKNDAKKLETIENKYNQMHSLCLQTSIEHHQMENETAIIAKTDNTYCKEETFTRKQLEEYTKQLDKKYPLFHQKRLNHLNSYAQLQNVINNKNIQDTAIIEYYLGAEQLYIFITFNGTTQAITSNYSDKDLETLIKNYNKPFRYVSLAPTKGLMIDILKKYDLKTSYKLYKILLKEPVEKLKTFENFNNKTNILIIPHKSLYYLSFESLITENITILPEENNIALSQYAELPYFIKQYSLSYLPSLSFLEFITSSKLDEKSFKDKTLIIGNPDLTITKKYTESVKELKQLPHSEKESTIIHSILEPQSDLIITDKATEKNIDSKIGHYNNYHFACHGILNDKEPLYSGLVLSREPYIVSSEKEKGFDGILYAYEILNKPFNSDLIVLSACDSGLGKLQSGEGMLGLTKSFLIAGANSLIITLWKINDESSSLFMKEFYSQNSFNLSTSRLEALRKAKLSMLKNTNKDFKSGKYDEISYSHPYFWAPFVYYGY